MSHLWRTILYVIKLDHSSVPFVAEILLINDNYQQPFELCKLHYCGSRGNEKNLFHDYTWRQPSAVTLNMHVNMWGYGIQFVATKLQIFFGHQYCQNYQQFSAPFRSRFGPIITIVGSWQYVHLKDRVLSFKTNDHLWKSVKN